MKIEDFIIQQTVGNLYWKDANGCYLGCNKEYANMIGLDKPEDIIGKTDRGLFLSSLGEERLQAILDLDQYVIQTGEEKTIEEVGVDSEGKTAYYITRKTPLKNDNNQIIGLVGNSINITKEKLAEISKREFMLNMEHDIRTPFSGILGMSSILYAKEDNPEKKELLGYIVEGANRLLNLLNEVLEISRLGSDPIKFTYFNLKDCLNDIFYLLLPEAKLKNIDFVLDCPDLMVHLDKTRLSRLILNLAGNAIKFTSSGKVSIIVDTTDKLKISVEDTGIGIPKDKLKVIFDKFTKLDLSHHHQKFMGAGIGLHIVKQYAIDLGGDVNVESEINKGSKFTFFIKK